MDQIVNLAAYKFVTLPEPQALHASLKGLCQELGLKGTVLIAPEGINIFVAGTSTVIEAFLNALQQIPSFTDIVVKKSYSAYVPFKRLYVKYRAEIISLYKPLKQRLQAGAVLAESFPPVVNPSEIRAPTIAPEKLCNWLGQGHDDLGRSVVMMDTRNAFEVDYGSFDHCIDYRLQRFSQFPEKLVNQSESLAGKTIVTFCTGGIRCEKAALIMQEMGFNHVYQLEGGILNYFEKVGGNHWHGDCFVFDEREALKPNLEPLRPTKSFSAGSAKEP